MFRHLMARVAVAVLAAGIGLGAASTAYAQHNRGGGGHMAGGGHAFSGGHASVGHAFAGARPGVGGSHFVAPRVGTGHAVVPRSFAYHGGTNFYRGGNVYHGGHGYYHGGYRYPYYGYARYGYRYPYYGYGLGLGTALGLAYRYPYYSYNYYGYGYPWYSGYSAYSYPDYGYSYYPDYYSSYGAGYAPQAANTESAYPPAEPAPVPATSAVITVQVPAGAQLWIDGQPTSQTGPVRTFQTPDTLEPGRTYSYRFTAQWLDNGQPVTRERIVNFEAGGQIVVNLTVP